MAKDLLINGIVYNGVESLSAEENGSGDILSFPDTYDADATSADMLNGKTAYVNGRKVTGSIQSQSAQTITPSTSNKTISSGRYLSGTQTIKGDANLVAGNIKSGVSIFGVAGSYTGESGGVVFPTVTPNGITITDVLFNADCTQAIVITSSPAKYGYAVEPYGIAFVYDYGSIYWNGSSGFYYILIGNITGDFSVRKAQGGGADN